MGTIASLQRDQVWSLASFDAGWYSDMLGRDVAYHALPAADEPGYEMSQHFPEIIAFLGRCREEGRKVLVHCVMGINRAPTAVVAFLCGGLGMSLEGAVDLTSRNRGHVLSNKSFLEQLIVTFGRPSSGKWGAK